MFFLFPISPLILLVVILLGFPACRAMVATLGLLGLTFWLLLLFVATIPPQPANVTGLGAMSAIGHALVADLVPVVAPVLDKGDP